MGPIFHSEGAAEGDAYKTLTGFGFANLGTEMKFVRFHVPYFPFTVWPLDFHGQCRELISKFHSGLFFLLIFHYHPF